MISLSRTVFGAGRTACTACTACTARTARVALPMSLSTRIPRLRHAAAACVLLFGLVACSARDDGSDVKRDASGAIAGASTPISRSTATAASGSGAGLAATASDAGSPSRAVSRTVVATVADTLAANADVYAGWRSFNINCQSCHGFNAVANDAAPDLRNSVRNGGTLTRAQFHEVVRKGRMAKGMPAWGELLDAKQIDQIYAYLRARSSGALGAGQPSVGGE